MVLKKMPGANAPPMQIRHLQQVWQSGEANTRHWGPHALPPTDLLPLRLNLPHLHRTQ